MTEVHGSGDLRAGGTGGDTAADVAVLETEPLGHRMHYTAHLVAAAPPGRCLLLTSAAAVESPDYALVSSAITGATVVLGETSTPGSALRSALGAARARGAAVLVVPEGDGYLLPLLALVVRRRLRGLQVRLLLLRTTTIGGPERLRPATLVKPVVVQLLRLSRSVQVLFLTDAFGVVQRRPGHPGVRPVRDPVRPPGRTPARPDWVPATAPGRTVVGVFGVVSPRKNLPLLVAAVVHDELTTLVVGGRLYPEVRLFLDTDADVRSLVAAGRLVVVDRLLTEDELAGALAAVDVVAVLHDNDSPSGILAEACARDTPALVPDGGWLAQVARTTGIGVVCTVDVAGVVAGLARVRTQAPALHGALGRASDLLGTADFTHVLVGAP